MNNKGGEASPTITGISPEESWISRMCFIFPLFFFLTETWIDSQGMVRAWSTGTSSWWWRGSHPPGGWYLLGSTMWIDQYVSRMFGLFTNMFPFILPLKWIDLLSCSIDWFPLDFPDFSLLKWQFFATPATCFWARRLWCLRLQEPATIAGTIVGSFLSKSALGNLFFNRESGCEGWDFYRCHSCMK